MADVNEYLDLLNDGSTENKQRLKSSLYSSADSSPDAESALVKISKRSGIPVEALRLDNGQEAKRRIAAEYADYLHDNAPATADLLSDPETAKALWDDAQALVGVEDVFKSKAPRDTRKISTGRSPYNPLLLLSNSFRSGVEQTRLGRMGYRKAAGLNVDDEEVRRLDRSIELANREMKDRGGFMGNFLAPAAQVVGQMFESGKTALHGGLSGAAAGAGAAAIAGQLGPQVALPEEIVTIPGAAIAGFAAGMGAGMAKDAMETEGGLAYLELKKLGNVDEDTARTAAVGVGLVNGALELAGLKFVAAPFKKAVKTAVMKKALESPTVWKAVKNFGKDYLGALGGETGTEILQEATNIAAEEITKANSTGEFDETSADKVATRLLDIASQTMRAMSVLAIPGAGAHFASNYSRATSAQQQTDFLTALGDSVKSTKSFERLPEKVQELVKRLKEQAGGSVDNVYIPADRWSMLWQDANVDPGDVAEEILGDRQQYQEAVAANSDIVIPLENFIKLAGTDNYNEILNDVRLNPGEMTPREHAEWTQNMDAEVERILSEAQSEESAAAPDRQVYDDVLGQLLAVGTDRGVAERQAALWQATLRTMGARAGIDPMELYRQYAPKIVRPLPEVLAKRVSVDMGIDPLLDRLRAGEEGAKDGDIFGPSLVEFINSKGGLQDAGGELAAMDAKKLIKKDGLELDRAREAAAEAGYLEQDSTVRDLLDALDEELRGRPRYAPGNQNNTLLEEKEALSQFREFLESSGIDLAEMDNEKVREVLGQGRLFQSERSELDNKIDETDKKAKRAFAKASINFDTLGKFETGKPVTFDFVHNTESATKLFGKPKKDSPFDRGYEPSGRYVTMVDNKDNAVLTEKMISGTLSFNNPLVVQGEKWKQNLSAAFGGKRGKKLSAAIIQAGYDGIVTIAESRSGKYVSEILDLTTFDYSKALFQSDDSTKRGFFDLSTNTIGLLENADLSTFLHESGHFFFQVLQDLASRPDAPQQIKDDYQALLEWFGTDKPEREHLEMFARGFEQYLGEGKAPTPELQGVFQRFKAWIVQVYRNLKNLNVPLTDEVRGVFDRLLATDEEIAQARENVGAKPLFATAEDAGMTEAEFAAYQKDALAEGVREEERLTAQLMKEYQREQEEWWKNQREGMRLLVEQEAKQNPVYEVLHLLTTGKTFDGSEVEPIKLSKDELVRRYGKDFLKRLPRGFHHIYTVDGGTSVDMVAEMYGFESGDDLIKQMIEAPKMKDWIEAETDVRMRQEYGDKLTDGTITEDALAAVHSDGRARILRAELAAIRKKQREVKPYVDAAKAGEKEELARQQREREYEMRWMEAEKKLAVAIERGAMKAEIDDLRAEMKAAKAMLAAMRRDMFAGIPPIDAFKEAARLTISQKKIFDLDPNAYMRAEQKAANKAFRAAAKNDFATAGEAKQQQLLNHFLYREARKAKDDAEKIYKHVKKIQTTAGQERIAKGGAQFLDQINSLLEMFQFQRATKREVTERETMRAWAARMEQEGLIIPIDDKILDAVENVNYRQATVEELRAFYDALRTIEAAARQYRQFRTASEALEWENVKDDLIVSILDTDMKSTGELSRPNNKNARVKDKAAALWRKFDAAHLKVEQIVEWLDGGKIDGPWAKYFFDWADHAQTKEYDYHAKITKQIQELNESMPKEWHGTMLDRTGVSLPGIEGKLDRYTLISIALNAGNDGNLQRLLDGNRWTPEALDEALKELSADDWKYIQGVWDIVDSLWPDIVELQERVAGVPPKKVEAREFTNEHGTFKGGYFPLAYDPKTSQAGEKQAAATDSVTDFMSQRYGRATTGKGHTKERMETVNARPLLDYERVLASHMAKVIKDLSHREAVFYINRILKDGEIKSLLIDRLGEDYYRQMNAWLQTLISDRADSIHQDLGFFPNIFRGLRTNTAIVTMGWKISTMMAQFAGFGPSVDLVGYVNMTKGLGQFLKSPRKTWEMVAEKSGEMRHRANTIDRDIKDELLKLRGAKGKVAAIKRTAFYLTAMADRMVSVPTWIAGYNKALREGYSEEDAIRSGDRAVRLSQGSGGAKDLAAVQRQDEFLKLITMYYTPFSVLYARQRDVGHTTKAPKDLPRAIARSIALVIFPAVMGELLAGRGPDDDEDAIWWAARKILLYPFAAVPVVRDLANTLEWSLSGSGFTPGYKISPLEDAVRKVVRAIGNLDDAWDGSKEWDDVAWDVYEASGYIFGLPTAQTRITGEYLEDLLTDGENTDKLSGVLFRRVKGR